MVMEAEHFVAAGFLIFLAVLIYAGVHRKVVDALDGRIDSVKAELAEAQKLRAEASALLASFGQKRQEAEAEAANIVAQARLEAELMAKEANARLTDFVARRTKQAQDKIALAETQATNDVRAAAADAAVKAAEIVLQADVKGPVGANLFDQGVKEVAQLAH